MRRPFALIWLFSTLILIRCSTPDFARAPEQPAGSLRVAQTNPELRALDLSENSTWQNDSAWPILPKLEWLSLRGNQLTELPAGIDQLVHLRFLDLGENRFERVPPELKNLPNLQVLFMDRNPLDSLNEDFSELSKLAVFDCWDCQIKFIHPQISEMKALQRMDLRRNYLGTRELKWLMQLRPDIEVKSTYGCDCD